MIRKLLLSLLFIGASLAVCGQFIPENLVVLRTGDGTTNITTSTSRVSLLEFSTSGTLVSTYNVNSTTANARLTIIASAAAEGLLKLSNDKNYLTFGG